MIKEIVAEYLWQGKWTGPGFPIYPTWWNDKPSGKIGEFYSLADYDRYQKEMAESPANEVLDIKPGTYILNIDYPCSGFEVPVGVPEKGITRQQLMDIAADSYHQMYKYVNEGIYANGIDDIERESNKYGIWGHSMGDLTIHTFYVDEEKNEISLGVDS